MTRESNTARENISTLLEAGKQFKDIAFAIKSRRSLLKDFYECTGRDLEPKQCDYLAELVKRLT